MSFKHLLIFIDKKPCILMWGFLLCVVANTAQAFDIKSGGAGTVHRQGANAFSMPSANMSLERRLDFSVGNSFFRNPWVMAPSTTTARDGLGPLFNTNGCQNCHIKDGRGHLPLSGDDNAVSVLVRLSVSPQSPQDWENMRREGVIAEPSYGTQIQDFSVPGVEPEAKIVLTYEKKIRHLPDESTVELSKPILHLNELAYGPLHPKTVTSLRVAPPMIGLGLLEAIPDSTLLAMADADDADGDGISGRVNRVWDVNAKSLSIGRFGWKSEQPSLEQQNAAAFLGDLGITSRLFPQDNCLPEQIACQKTLINDGIEVSDKILQKVTFYSRNLAVPARRNTNDPEVQKGQSLFVQANCNACHRTSLRTASLTGQPEQSDQLIHPYTDLLLHDMGDGLSDDRPVFRATGREWRTAPLWGIGLTKEVSGHEFYLHDGRAKTLQEAILWHGGEAEASKNAFENFSSNERHSLLSFLKSL